MAHNDSISCPSCGVAIEHITAHTRSLACPHCGNWVWLGSNGWEVAGLFAHAIDAPSMLQLGRSGELAGRRFVVSGRVRLSYSEGFWDEWWLDFDDGNHQWIEEDEGVYRIHHNKEVTAQAAELRNASVGGQVSINDTMWLVTERVDADVAGVEGSLPVAIIPGEEVVCIDVLGNGSKISIEATEHEVQVSQSEVVRAAKFNWD